MQKVRSAPYRRLLTLAGFLVVLFPIAGWGQNTDVDIQGSQIEAPEMTLGAAIGLALRNNRTIKTSQVAHEAKQFSVRLQESLFTPQYSLESGVSATRLKQTQNEVSSLVNQMSYEASLSPKVTLQNSYGTSFTLLWKNAYNQTKNKGSNNNSSARYTAYPALTLVQPLLKGFGSDVNTANLKIARLNSQLSQLGMRDTVSRTVTAVINTYWQVTLNKKKLEIATLALERAQQILEINRSLVASGRMAELDMVQAETDVAQKEFDLDVIDNTYKQSKNALLALLSLSKRIDFTPSDIGEIERIEVPLQIAYELAEKNRYEVIQAETSVALAKISLRLAKDGEKWDLRLIGQAESNNVRHSYFDALKGIPSDSNQLSIGMQLVIPINSLEQEAAVINAKGEQEIAKLTLEETKQTVRLDVQDTIRDVSANYRQVELAERARALAQSQLDIELEKLSLGRSSNFQVLTYQDTLRSAQLSKISSEINYLTAISTLDFALGTTLDTWNINVTDETAYMTSNVPLPAYSATERPGTKTAVQPPPN
ncbi:TolC family protein [Terasakiella pusilla]|uniref:TolC family protein n=1 Tax=Terasakiella pusilla TaxID=64973 RepID=UPI003AA83123